jgi:hypothetical protein
VREATVIGRPSRLEGRAREPTGGQGSAFRPTPKTVPDLHLILRIVCRIRRGPSKLEPDGEIGRDASPPALHAASPPDLPPDGGSEVNGLP